MSNGLIVRLIPLTPAMLTVSSGTNPAFPVGNLVDPQPKVVWQTFPVLGDYNYSITADLGTDTRFDTIGLMFNNASAASLLRVTANTAAQGPGGAGATILSADAATRPPTSSKATRFHALRRFAPYTGRYVTISISESLANADGVLRAGILIVGQSWQCELPYANFELGSGRRITDLSDVRQLPGGEKGIWRKARVPSFRATWSNMTEADRRALWSILEEIGESGPVVAIEDPDATAGLQERIHYGTFAGLSFDERVQTDKCRIELTIEDWL